MGPLRKRRSRTSISASSWRNATTPHPRRTQNGEKSPGSVKSAIHYLLSRGHAPRPNILLTINFHQLPKAGASRSRIRDASTTEFDIRRPSEDRKAQDGKRRRTRARAQFPRYRGLGGKRGGRERARGHRSASQTVPPLSKLRGRTASGAEREPGHSSPVIGGQGASAGVRGHRRG